VKEGFESDINEHLVNENVIMCDNMPFSNNTDRFLKEILDIDKSESLVCDYSEVFSIDTIGLLVNENTANNNNEQLKVQMEKNKDLQSKLKQFLSQTKF
jgi:hypothetical protein